MRYSNRLLAAVVAMAASAAQPARAAINLVENGQPRAILIVPKDAAADEESAAREIQSHVEEISGARLAIVTEGETTAGRTRILIGRAAPAALDPLIRQKGNDPCSFALVAGPGSASGSGRVISLRGLSPAGTRIAAAELLEQLGVRWFMPGELGTVIPRSSTVQLAEQTTVQVPAFAARWTTTARSLKEPGRIWELRVRMGGPQFPSSHGIPLARSRDETLPPGAKGARKAEAKKAGGDRNLFTEHPEYYALIDGQRVPRQLCVSNPAVLAMAIAATRNYFRQNPNALWIGMGPDDGGGFCQCENCQAMDGGDYDPIAHTISMTDRYITFFNRVLEAITDEFPERKIAFYAYATYMRPPVKVKPNPRIVPATAVIGLCRLHGMGNPVCPEKSYEKWITAEWGKLLPEVYNRGYWFNLADPGLCYPMIGRLKTEIPLGRELGVKGWRVETIDHLAASAPAVYVAARLMWDEQADVDALMRDFYEKFFGLAAAAMREYLETMDAAITQADYHTGCSWDIPLIYTAAVRSRARAALDRAAEVARDIYAQRVQMYRKNLDYTEAFIAMLERRMANDYTAAQQSLDRMVALRDELVRSDPPLLEPKAAVNYLNRFFRPATEAGYQRTTGGNQLVAGFAPEWDFQIDPERIGEAIGLVRVENRGGNWQRLRSDMSWSDQGLRYYKGLAWYRQVVNVPASAAGQRVFLWCGGVDEKADVWINGRAIGASAVPTFAPFELDATAAVTAGKPNVVVIRITNDKLNELGTGGILGPVMFYAPKDGARAKPENGGGPARDESMEVIARPAAKE